MYHVCAIGLNMPIRCVIWSHVTLEKAQAHCIQLRDKEKIPSWIEYRKKRIAIYPLNPSTL